MFFLYRKINFGNACHLISNRQKIRIPLDLMEASKSLLTLLPMGLLLSDALWSP